MAIKHTGYSVTAEAAAIKFGAKKIVKLPPLNPGAQTTLTVGLHSRKHNEIKELQKIYGISTSRRVIYKMRQGFTRCVAEFAGYAAELTRSVAKIARNVARFTRCVVVETLFRTKFFLFRTKFFLFRTKNHGKGSRKSRKHDRIG